MDTMEKINISEIYLKSEKVLNSSKTLGQLQTSKNYIDNYLKQTGDMSGYDVLIKKYFKLKNELFL